MDEQIVKMSLEDLPKFVNDENPELAIARLMFLSTRPNSHGFTITEDVLMKYASTVLGKFLIGNLNMWESDVTTHLQEPDIFGYMPINQEIEFVRASDGYLDAYVNAVVSKVYATKVYNLFTKDNFRNVSVEMTLRYADEQEKLVESFNVCGVTILGKDVNPSVPKAHMEIIKFSADKAEKFYKQTSILDKMAKLASANNKQETEVLETLNPIYNKLNLKETVNNEQAEEKMAKLEEQEKDVVMEKPTEDEAEKKDEKLAEETPKEDDKKSEEVEEKASDEKKDEDKADDDKGDEKEEEKLSDEVAEKDAKCEELEAKCAEYEAKCAELEAKLSELEQFKADTENKEKMSIVTQTLAQVKDSMNEEEFAKFEAKANDYTIETINAWRNEVLANVATVLMSKKGEDESHLRMSVETPDNTPKGLWDRM